MNQPSARTTTATAVGVARRDVVADRHPLTSP